MSVGYNPKDSLVMDQSLKVQEVDMSGNDVALYSLTNYSGSAMVFIREPVNSVYLVRLKVDSSNTWTEFQAASITIVDSASTTAHPSTTSGFNEQGVPVSDQGAILISGISAINPNDILMVKYVVQEHL